MGVYARGKKLWIRFRDAGGKWRDASTHYEVGQEALAQATHDEVVARVGALGRTVKHAPARGVTVRVFASDWIAKRRERDLDWKNDESRLKHHVLADLGELVLADVRARHVVDLFHKLRTDRERNLVQRTIYNIYTVVSAMFRDAKFADLIEQTRCILDERQLGPLADADPEWRSEAVFTRAEVETVISDARIPDDRQMAYALEGAEARRATARVDADAFTVGADIVVGAGQPGFDTAAGSSVRRRCCNASHGRPASRPAPRSAGLPPR
jgi:hypothetical protein